MVATPGEADGRDGGDEDAQADGRPPVVITPLDVRRHWQPAWCEVVPSNRFCLPAEAAPAHAGDCQSETDDRNAHGFDAGQPAPSFIDLHRQPDGSAWFRCSSEITEAAAFHLFSAVRQHAAAHQVQLLQTAAFGRQTLSADCLQQLEFTRSPAIEQWRAPCMSPAVPSTPLASGRLWATESPSTFLVDCGDRQWPVSRATVCRLIAHTLEDAPAGIGDFVPEPADLLSLWQNLRPAADLHVAVLQEELQGLIVCSRTPAVTTVQYLGMRPACRRQGGGRLLLSLLGHQTLETFVMRHNEPARQLYERVGFTPQRADRPWFRRFPAARAC